METNEFMVNVYDRNCPTRKILDRISDKWTPLIIGLLNDKIMRFSELHRSVDGISQKMLTQTLRNLERDGLVIRTVYAEVPPRVEYALTELGETLVAPIVAIWQWTERHYEAVRKAQEEYDRRVDEKM